MTIEFGTAVMSSQGQITIPKSIRRVERLKKGTKLTVVDVDGKITIQKPDIRKAEEIAQVLGGKVAKS